MSLYLKYRPQEFSDLVGQDTIKKTLENAIKTGHISHGYLFVGPKGTGKTSSARLLSKALNCSKRKSSQSEPCNQCSSCKEISSGHSLDVLEIDAASNRGIDEIRDLRDKIRYAPSSSKFKIFIIDEVHMLTKESFNALLKTLEEPPKHAIFIMATTEPDKIPDTILSRVQEFQFSRASIADLTTRINKIVKIEEIKIDLRAIDLIAQKSDGSFRDALSILDQVNSLGEKNISLDLVEKTIGLVGEEKVGDFIEFLIDNKPSNAIKLIHNIHIEGYDLVEFNNQIIFYLRNLLLFLTKAKLNLIISENELKRIEKMSCSVDIRKVLKNIAIFINSSKDIKNVETLQLPLELAVYDICENEMPSVNKTDKIIKKDKIEIKNNLKSKEIIVSIADQQKEKINVLNEIKENKSKENHQEKWIEFVDKISKTNRSLSLLLKDSQFIGLEEGKFTIGVKFKFYAEKIEENKNYEILSAGVEEVFGEKCKIDCMIQNNKIIVKDKKETVKVEDDLASQAMEVFDI